jgi:plastocyanin
MNVMRMVVFVAVVVAAAAPAAAAGAAATVGIEEFAFTPPVLTVDAGTTVTWINHDEEPHTITATNGGFGSAGLSRDDVFSQQFARPGRYEYFCALHPQMRATVVVR